MSGFALAPIAGAPFASIDDSGDAGVVGSLTATLADDVVEATALVFITATVAATLDDDVVIGTGAVPVSAMLSVTLDDDQVVAAAAQVGPGALGVLDVVLDDDAVDAAGTIDLAVVLDATLDDDAVAAFVLSGTNGPFAQRPLLVLN